MRRILVFVAGGLGLGALWRRRRRRKSSGDSGYLPYDDGRDPAAELRAKLAQSHAAQSHAAQTHAVQAKAAEVEDASAAEPEDEGSPLDPQSRRRNVHERARASIDELG